MKRTELKRKRRETPQPRECGHCGETFKPHSSVQPGKFCSHRCSAQAKRAKVLAGYPPREEVVALYVVEGLSDKELGLRFGHSYQWAFLLREHYGIAGKKARPPKKPLHKKSDRARWSIDLKREEWCRNCGSPNHVLALHHAIPRSMCRAAKYDLRNGVPLCTTCHLGWHRRAVALYRDIFTEDEWAFISSVQLTGQEIGPWLDERYPERVLESDLRKAA